MRYTQEEFIEKARKVHGDKYDYSQVEYINSKTPITIICPIHGPFEQIPNSHLQGKGCRKCGNIKRSQKLRMTQEEFIEKARKVHGDKYDYSKTIYKDNKTKIRIICKNCGHEFLQFPTNHCSTHNQNGCPKCKGGEYNERFIEKARKVHGDKYDYSQVKYVDARTPVTIICPIHGPFRQTPESHLNGKKCHRCTGKGAFKYTQDEFIEKAREVHGDKYDYSKIKYIDMRTPVCIICRECGNEFWQAPYNHVNGSGCIHCYTLKSEKSVGLFLKEKGIKVIKQKRFKWLGQLRLDFYLPDYNIAIEYQGEQHFHPVKHFGGEKRYRDRIERDARKKCLCEQNNVKLLYVSFYKKPTYKVIDNLNDLLNIIKKYEI